MDTQSRLPFFGVGPYYFAGVMALAGVFFLLGEKFPRWCLVPFPAGRNVFIGAGAVLAIFGAFLWLSALIGARLAKNIAENKLITTGVYAHVRNPIYSAFMFIGAGVLSAQSNWLCLPYFGVCWLALTVMVKLTEEKWLAARFGEVYRAYCRKVNRCIPWI